MRKESVIWVLCIDSRLNSMSQQWHMDLRSDREFLTSRNTQLPLNKIETRDHLSNWVLNLEPRVHLHEVERVISCVKNELYCACIVVANSLCCRNSSLANF